MPRLRTSIALAAVLLLATACSSGGDGDGAEGSPSSDDPSWATSTDPVATDGLVWAEGSVVHLPDGTTVDTGTAMLTYVVAGDGVYFTPADGEDLDHGNMTTGPLSFADRDGEVVETGLTVYVESIGASADGRYLGVVDATSGPEDDFSGYHQATAVVVDLTSGDSVVDTTDGMGDPAEDDLAHDYPEIYLGVHFPTADSAFVEGLGDDIVYALPSGEGEPTDAGVRSPTDPTSPGGEWSIEDRGFDDRVLDAAGDVVRLDTGAPRLDLRWWLDESTVVGIAIAGPGEGQDLGPGDTSTLVTCELPDGSCSPVDGAAGARVRFPVGAGDEGLDLRASGGGS